MKNTFGSKITLTIFGESHGNAIGCVLDGIAPGICVDEEYIKVLLSLRRPAGAISTSRREADEFVIESGVFNGYTTGTPICIVIPNKDTRSGDYGEMAHLARPSHADYTANVKYRGFQDHRGGGHFSGRITAAVVAAGGILLKALEAKGITVGTHIKRCGGISDREFGDIGADIKTLSTLPFAVLDENASVAMQDKILSARSSGDSLGGVLETAVVGLEAGLGEPWFDSVESLLSHALFSVPAVKGVEFGAGFAITEMLGSQANDPFFAKDGSVFTSTNNSGGINGGITNGMPVIFRCAIRPTPTISREQNTIDYITKENKTLAAAGRHDPCIVHRARIVVDCITALVLADLLAERHGTDWLAL
ncbi:MAG: chorismate synthase [Clostridia bacterium]|nr:chorismate synthase [Clostridia bacterium]